MPDTFPFDVFLSHSAQDKAIVRDIAARLKKDGVRVWFDEEQIKPGDNIPAKIEEGLENSRVQVLCMSANAFASDWSQLESSTFRFRDPLNKERRFLILRLDDVPIKGPLFDSTYLDWLGGDLSYPKLLATCEVKLLQPTGKVEREENMDVKRLNIHNSINSLAFSWDGRRVLTGGSNNTIQVWDVASEACVKTIRCHKKTILHIEWSEDENRALVWSDEDNVRLLDISKDKILTDYGKAFLSKRQMDCFRLLAGGLSSHHIRHKLGLHSITVESHLQSLRKCFGLKTRDELRQRVNAFYSIDSNTKTPLLSANSTWMLMIAFEIEKNKALSKRWAQHKHLRLCTNFDGIPIKLSGEQMFTNAWSVDWCPDMRTVACGYKSGSIRIWDALEGRCLEVFEGHTSAVECLAWHPSNRWLLSGSKDGTVRLWSKGKVKIQIECKLRFGQIVKVSWSGDGRRALIGTGTGRIITWDLSLLTQRKEISKKWEPAPHSLDIYVQYSNAKVLVVGDTNAGKTGLAHRFATGEWKPSKDSTVGAWSTQWPLKHDNAEPGVDREIWLWDFGGQADQRLIHQLYMDRTALILLLFNADQEDVLPGLRDWQTALRRCVKEKIPHFLVAGRIDTGFKASRGKLQSFAREQGLTYHETSAKSGEGCNELRAAMIASIPWAQMEKRTSPRIFKLIKDEILRLRDEGQVLHTFKELRELLWKRLPNEPRFTDETLQTVIGLLDGPGAVKELDYGTYILLAPEWINAYAQAVIRTLRNAENDLGVLPLRSIAEGKLIYQSIGRDGTAMEMKRLPPTEERVLLGEMERQLEQRGLCLRQGDKLVFPSHCGRDRPAMLKHPSIFVSYAVKGFLDDIYATLVVKLADSESFTLTELWRDAADFVTLSDDHHMGIKLTRETASDGDISVYFGKGVTQQEQVIFANYIHAHLEGTCEDSKRLRHYVCPHCHTAKGNPEALMQKLMTKKEKAEVVCDVCDKPFPLWDSLEKKFASKAVCGAVLGMRKEDDIRLTTRRQGKLLVLEVGARITSANQKWFEIPTEEDDGIDIQMEFTDQAGNGVGEGLCLQLKAGNSFLTKRKTDDVEVFKIKKQRWVKTWMNQPFPVMLVIGTLPEDRDLDQGSDKVQFERIRWMEITSVLKQLSENGTKPVTQIEFHGEEVNMTTVMHWRKKVMSGE